MVAVDPNGEEIFTTILVGIIVGAAIGGGTYAATTNKDVGSRDWFAGLGMSMLIGEVAVRIAQAEAHSDRPESWVRFSMKSGFGVSPRLRSLLTSAQALS